MTPRHRQVRGSGEAAGRKVPDGLLQPERRHRGSGRGSHGLGPKADKLITPQSTASRRKGSGSSAKR